MYVEKYVLIGVFTCHKKKSVWFVCLFLYYSFSVFLLILTILFYLYKWGILCVKTHKCAYISNKEASKQVNKQLQDTIRN